LGAGFVSAFSGGGTLVLAGLGLLLVLFFRYRGRHRGWSALPYGLGASAVVLLLPYVLRPGPCPPGGPSPDCYRAFTVGTFATAVAIAFVGLGFALYELRSLRKRVTG
jgi:hypothetical protein